MPSAFVQKIDNSQVGPGPNSIPVSMTNTAGNLLIAINRMNPGLNSSVTDTLGNTWSPGPGAGHAGIFAFGLFLHFVQNCLGGANTITGHTNGTTDEAIAVYEYSGVAIAGGALGANYNAVNGPGTGADILTSGTFSVSTVPALLFAFGADFSGGAMPPNGTGFTPRGAVWSNYASTQQAEDQRILVSSSPAGTFSLVASGGDVYGALAVAFAEAGGLLLPVCSIGVVNTVG